MPQVTLQSIQARLHQSVQAALASSLAGEPFRQVVTEADDTWTKQELERTIRKVLKQDLEAEVLKLLKKELKAQSTEDLIVGLVVRALAKYHEIMFTRKSTWTNQLKAK